MSDAKRLRRATINDVAKDAGVSRSTVSLVLQQNPRIPPETAKRVEQSMRRLGYTYNRNAANLRRQTSEAVGLIINDIRNPFFAEMIAGIQGIFDEKGLMVYLVESANDASRQDHLLQSLIEHGVAGVILCVATHTEAAFMTRLRDSNLKVCLAVRRPPDSDFDFAGTDSYEAGRIATEHLLELGHRRIAFLGGEAANSVRIDRLAGYFSALSRNGIALDPDLITESIPSQQNAISDMNKVLSLTNPPTAALAYNDHLAIASMKALRANGLEPGREFALVGFDGTPDGEVSFPSLTSVSMHPHEIGQCAAKFILNRLQFPEMERQFVNLRPTLVVRNSSMLTSSKAFS